MTGLVLNPYSQFLDDAGLPVANGTVTFWVNNTTTLSPLFTDNTGMVQQANPYTLDASGRITGDIWYSGVKTLQLRDEGGGEIRTIDDVTTLEDLEAFFAALDFGIIPQFESFAALLTEDFTGEDRVETASFYPLWEGTLEGPVGGSLYYRDGTTGTPSTAYAGNSGFYDANGDGFSIFIGDSLSVEQLGAIGDGVEDDTAIVFAALSSGVSNLIFGKGKTYYLLDLIYSLAAPIHIDLNDSVLNFNVTAAFPNAAGLAIQSDNVVIENGEINMLMDTVGPAASAGVAIFGGNGTTGVGHDNIEIKNLVLGTNGLGVIVMLGENTNVRVDNITIKDSATIRIAIAFEWGGTAAGTGHPHNIKISNINCGKLTFPGDPVTNYTCVVWLSSSFNVDMTNIFAEQVPTLVNVVTGDLSNLYAPNEYARLVGTNISIDTAACEDITGYGIRVYGLGSGSPIPLPQTTKIKNLRLKDKGEGLYTTNGVRAEYCTGVTVENFSLDTFIYGIVTGPDVERLSCRYGEVKNSGLLGAQIGSTGFTTVSPTLDNVHFYNNNAQETSGLTSAAAILLTDTIDAAVSNCRFGNEGETETQRYSVSVTAAAVRPRLNNNHTHALAASGVAYIIGIQDDDIEALGLNNTSADGLTNVGGAPIFNINTSGDREFSLPANPATGTYKQGDRVYYSDPVAAGFIGAVCVTAGTPGTWKTFGAISA